MKVSTVSFIKRTWMYFRTQLLPTIGSLAVRRLAIAAISIFDAILLFVFSDGIVFEEENPIGLALIRASDGDVTRFAMVKLACTGLVILVLRQLERRDFLAASIVTNALLSFQTWLLWYLCLSTYWTTSFEMVAVAVLCVAVFLGPVVRTFEQQAQNRKPLLGRQSS